MNFDEGVEFDPGYINHITAFVPNIEYVYETLAKFKNFGQKKLQFKIFYPKIQILIRDYTSFYLGCMLWAIYIKKLEGKTILNNLCFGGEYSETETVEEVDFIEKYIEQLKKDTKYYLGQNFLIDNKTEKVLSAYKQFLTVNNGFVKTAKTDDIVIPQILKTPNDSELESILDKIKEVVATGKLSELLPFVDKIL